MGFLTKLKEVQFIGIVPVLACGTGMAWSLKVHGKKAHTEFPHNGINPIPIAMEAVKKIVEKFNELCPHTEEDDKYKFKTHSNMKPTIVKMPDGASANQYADWVEIIGDVRMTPTKFNDPFQLKVDILEFVEQLNVHELPKWHEAFGTKCGEGENEVEAKIEFNWVFGPYCGIVTNLESDSYKLIRDATLAHHPTCDSCSDLGAVPLVKQMQDAGIDIQIMGYGVGDVYHGNDEYCTLSGMKKGFYILKTLLEMAHRE
jgi:acetylornithine deacetylase